MRSAIPHFRPLLSREELFALAQQDDVESRLIEQRRGRWSLDHGPFPLGRMPSAKGHRSTLLVQGVDGHDDRVHSLLARFRFLPDARLDDVMISWANDGGGVGPHFDSYDVFLLQAFGRRRWRIGRQADLALEPNLPVKILRRFVPEAEYTLDPGDLLYLPPEWAHEGVAVGECMTYSIGFNAPRAGPFATELLARVGETRGDLTLYADAGNAATDTPARVPESLRDFARAAVARLTASDEELGCALGESLSEPKPGVAFEPNLSQWRRGAVVLDRRTRMLYDERFLYINGDSYRAGGADARLMRALADSRRLDAAAVSRASAAAVALLREWFAWGWLQRAGRHRG